MLRRFACARVTGCLTRVAGSLDKHWPVRARLNPSDNVARV